MKNSVDFEQVFYNKKIVATIIHLGRIKNKASFFTLNKDTVQAGVLNKREGEFVKPHFHVRPPLREHNIEEIILILKGRARVNFYTKEGKFICTRLVMKNDLLIQNEMGHSFEVLKDISFLEIKPGPYLYDKKEIRAFK